MWLPEFQLNSFPVLKELFFKTFTKGFLCVCIALCFFAGSASALSTSPGPRQGALNFFFENNLTGFSIGFSTLFAGFIGFHIEKMSGLRRRIVTSFLFSITGGMIGRIVSIILHLFLLRRIASIDTELLFSSITIVMIATAIALPALLIRHFRFINPELNSNRSKKINTLSAKTGSNEIHLIEYNDIDFVTAKGKHSVVHAGKRDYETSEPVEELLSKLPADLFLRVHRKYCLNLKHVAAIQHHKSGDYMAYLKGDDFVVPVSKKYIPALKNALKI
ncbi:MAG: LytTR family transcriptional regulator [Leptospira sp.]|nr:LytTR family transcriptional regulator [Leptospira sp.]